MRLESVRELKAELHEEAAGLVGPFIAEAVGMVMPTHVAVGIARKGPGAQDFRPAIRTHDPRLAAQLEDRFAGECDVRILRVEKRETLEEWLRGRRRPLEPGCSIGPASHHWAGTLSCFVRDSQGEYALTNSHVAADMGLLEVGTSIVQPAIIEPDGAGAADDVIGVLDRFVPVSATKPNLVDAALVKLRAGTRYLPGWDAAIADPVVGMADIGPEDLGAEVWKVGRTTGIRKGLVTAVEVDGLPVGYGAGRVYRFNQQFEVSGGPKTDFSDAGDSGSLILDARGIARGLLFAGGRDNTGEDFTYANRLMLVAEALGVEVQLAA